MDRKVIFLDLDGTLTNDDKKVTPKTLKALKQIMEERTYCGACIRTPNAGSSTGCKNT